MSHHKVWTSLVRYVVRLTQSIPLLCRMCSEWFELVEKAKLSNEQTEQLTVAAQAQFKVINIYYRFHLFYHSNTYPLFFCIVARICSISLLSSSCVPSPLILN